MINVGKNINTMSSTIKKNNDGKTSKATTFKGRYTVSWQVQKHLINPSNRETAKKLAKFIKYLPENDHIKLSLLKKNIKLKHIRNGKLIKEYIESGQNAFEKLYKSLTEKNRMFDIEHYDRITENVKKVFSSPQPQKSASGLFGKFKIIKPEQIANDKKAKKILKLDLDSSLFPKKKKILNLDPLVLRFKKLLQPKPLKPIVEPELVGRLNQQPANPTSLTYLPTPPEGYPGTVVPVNKYTQKPKIFKNIINFFKRFN